LRVEREEEEEARLLEESEHQQKGTKKGILN